jgi:hypothetical protein
VETLRATFAGGEAKAETPARKQIYENAMSVCSALTSAMDDRAKAASSAETASMAPTLSDGGSVVKSAAVNGNTEAIRKKQRDERKYADKNGPPAQRLCRVRGLPDVDGERAEAARERHGALHKQMQLEALEEKSGAPAVKADAETHAR